MSWDTFLAAWEDGTWEVQVCRACGSATPLPRAGCPRCGAADWDVRPAAGPGRITTWTRVHHAFHERAAGAPPFCVAVVALEEFPRGAFVAEYVETEAMPPRCGQEVHVVSHRGADGKRRPAFGPGRDGGA